MFHVEHRRGTITPLQHDVRMFHVEHRGNSPPTTTQRFECSTWNIRRTPVGALPAEEAPNALFAAVIGAVFLGERVGVVRFLAAGLVVAGIVLIAQAR